MKTILVSFILFLSLCLPKNTFAQNQISSPTSQSIRIDTDTTLVRGYIRIDSGFIKLNEYRFLGITKTSTGRLNSWAGAESGNLTMTGGWNTFMGERSGYVNSSGQTNTFAGTLSGMANSTGNANTFLGYKTGLSNNSGTNNVFIGPTTGNFNTTGGSNVMIGMDAGFFNETGSNNVYLGRNSGLENIAGTKNVSVGSAAGYSSTGSGNVFLGYQTGLNVTSGDNRLYIANTSTANPLIYGEFGTTSPAFAGKVVINGRLSINSSTFPASVDTNNTSGFKLFVNGGLLAKRLVVKTNWADYVFQADYNLSDLATVEKHIKRYGHLPKVASAKELEKTGIDVGTIKRMQMEKIEELTLYALQQDRQLQNQTERLSEQRKILDILIKKSKILKND